MSLKNEGLQKTGLKKLLQYQESIEGQKKLFTTLGALPFAGSVGLGLFAVSNILAGWKGVQRTRMRPKEEGDSKFKKTVLYAYYGCGKVIIGGSVLLTASLLLAPLIATIGSAASLIKSTKNAWNDRHKNWHTQVRNMSGLTLEATATGLLVAALFTPIAPLIIGLAAATTVATCIYKGFPLLSKCADAQLKNFLSPSSLKGYEAFKKKFATHKKSIEHAIVKKSFRLLQTISLEHITKKEYNKIAQHAKSLKKRLNAIEQKSLVVTKSLIKTSSLEDEALQDYTVLKNIIKSILKKANPDISTDNIEANTKTIFNQSLNKFLELATKKDCSKNKLIDFINNEVVSGSNEKMCTTAFSADAQAFEKVKNIIAHVASAPKRKIRIVRRGGNKTDTPTPTIFQVFPKKDDRFVTALTALKDRFFRKKKPLPLYETMLTPNPSGTQMSTTVNKKSESKDRVAIFTMYQKSGAPSVTLTFTDTDKTQIKAAIIDANRAGFEYSQITIKSAFASGSASEFMQNYFPETEDVAKPPPTLHDSASINEAKSPSMITQYENHAATEQSKTSTPSPEHNSNKKTRPRQSL